MPKKIPEVVSNHPQRAYSFENLLLNLSFRLIGGPLPCGYNGWKKASLMLAIDKSSHNLKHGIPQLIARLDHHETQLLQKTEEINTTNAI